LEHSVYSLISQFPLFALLPVQTFPFLNPAVCPFPGFTGEGYTKDRVKKKNPQSPELFGNKALEIWGVTG